MMRSTSLDTSSGILAASSARLLRDGSPLLVVMTSIACRPSDWAPVAENLPADCGVLLVRVAGTNPGRPRWAHHHGQVGLDPFADDLRLVLAEIDRPDCIVVGHNLTAAAALRMAALYPEQVHGVVAVCTPLVLRLAEPPPALAFRGEEPAGGADPFRLKEHIGYSLAHQFLGPSPLAEIVQRYEENLLSIPSPCLTSLLDEMARIDLRRDAPRVREPVIVIACDGDPAVPDWQADALVEALPRGTLLSLEVPGHFPQLTDPLRLGTALARSIDEIDAATA